MVESLYVTRGHRTLIEGVGQAVTRAAIYTRISRDRIGIGAGVDRQEADCRALCEAREWSVVEVFTDNDLSAYRSRKPRPRYTSMMEAVRGGQLDVIVAWHPDRLHRSPLELEAFIDDVEAAAIQVVTVGSGEFDLSTASGRMTARVVGAVARHESEQKSERIRRKHRQLAEEGKSAGGGPTRPFGFEDDRITHNTDEADLIRDAVKSVIAGGSIRGITFDWDAKGVTTTTGLRVYPTAVRRILRSARIAGFRELDGAYYPAQWQPMITEAEFFQVRAILDDPSRRMNHHPRKYLLTGGLARCGLCGMKLVARPRGDGRRCYVCASDPQLGGCGKIRVLAEPFERFVEDQVVQVLDGPQLARAVAEIEANQESSGTGAGTEILAVQSQQAELADMWATGGLSTHEWETARRGLEKRMSEAVSELEMTDQRKQAAVLSAEPGVLADTWSDLDVAQRRDVIGAVVQRIEVGAALRGRNFFDPDRVRLQWTF